MEGIPVSLLIAGTPAQPGPGSHPENALVKLGTQTKKKGIFYMADEKNGHVVAIETCQGRTAE